MSAMIIPAHGEALRSELRQLLAESGISVRQAPDEAGWRPIDDAAKAGGSAKPVLLAVRVVYRDGERHWHVGEAWWNAKGDPQTIGWWWAGTGPHGFASDTVDEMTGEPVYWQPMPAHPEEAP